MNALDTVASMVPSTMKVQGLLDAAALLDIDPNDAGWSWSSELTPLQSIIGELVSIDDPQLPISCEIRFPGESWKCLIGQARRPAQARPQRRRKPAQPQGRDSGCRPDSRALPPVAPPPKPLNCSTACP